MEPSRQLKCCIKSPKMQVPIVLLCNNFLLFCNYKMTITKSYLLHKSDLSVTVLFPGPPVTNGKRSACPSPLPLPSPFHFCAVLHRQIKKSIWMRQAGGNAAQKKLADIPLVLPAIKRLSY